MAKTIGVTGIDRNYYNHPESREYEIDSLGNLNIYNESDDLIMSFAGGQWFCVNKVDVSEIEAMRHERDILEGEK